MQAQPAEQTSLLNQKTFNLNLKRKFSSHHRHQSQVLKGDKDIKETEIHKMSFQKRFIITSLFLQTYLLPMEYITEQITSAHLDHDGV